MGYTHYWKWTEDIDNPEKFAQWSKDVELLSKNLPGCSTTAGAYYDHEPLLIGGLFSKQGSEPVFTDKKVLFNGKDPKDRDLQTEESLAHSDFSIRQEDMSQPLYDFCPTGRKPYDLLVCAALIRLKKYFPAIRIASDGGPREWIQAINLCLKIFNGDGCQLPFTEKDEAENYSWT